MDNCSLLQEEAVSAMASASSIDILTHLKHQYLGKGSVMADALASLSHLSADLRAEKGRQINLVKQTIQQAYQARKHVLEEQAISEALAREAIDVSLPGRLSQTRASMHPLLRVKEMIEGLFASMGFDKIAGPEIETEWHAFTALNTPEKHPARSMQDTFFLPDQLILRPHTSSVQIRHLLEHKPPVRIISPGRVYRVDSDATHSPMFYQLEGLSIEPAVSFACLKAVLSSFFQRFFHGHKVDVRFRASFFPFTKPSAEVDISCLFCHGSGCSVCSHSGWLEVAGCGMVHPHVLSACDIDPEQHSGFAFGIGIDRLTMLYYGIDDLRLLYENDWRFLSQF